MLQDADGNCRQTARNYLDNVTAICAIIRKNSCFASLNRPEDFKVVHYWILKMSGVNGWVESFFASLLQHFPSPIQQKANFLLYLLPDNNPSDEAIIDTIIKCRNDTKLTVFMGKGFQQLFQKFGTNTHQLQEEIRKIIHLRFWVKEEFEKIRYYLEPEWDWQAAERICKVVFGVDDKMTDREKKNAFADRILRQLDQHSVSGAKVIVEELIPCLAILGPHMESKYLGHAEHAAKQNWGIWKHKIIDLADKALSQRERGFQNKYNRCTTYSLVDTLNMASFALSLVVISCPDDIGEVGAVFGQRDESVVLKALRTLQRHFTYALHVYKALLRCAHGHEWKAINNTIIGYTTSPVVRRFAVAIKHIFGRYKYGTRIEIPQSPDQITENMRREVDSSPSFANMRLIQKNNKSLEKRDHNIDVEVNAENETSKHGNLKLRNLFGLAKNMGSLSAVPSKVAALSVLFALRERSSKKGKVPGKLNLPRSLKPPPLKICCFRNSMLDCLRIMCEATLQHDTLKAAGKKGTVHAAVLLDKTYEKADIEHTVAQFIQQTVESSNEDAFDRRRRLLCKIAEIDESKPVRLSAIMSTAAAALSKYKCLGTAALVESVWVVKCTFTASDAIIHQLTYGNGDEVLPKPATALSLMIQCQNVMDGAINKSLLLAGQDDDILDDTEDGIDGKVLAKLPFKQMSCPAFVRYREIPVSASGLC